MYLQKKGTKYLPDLSQELSRINELIRPILQIKYSSPVKLIIDQYDQYTTGMREIIHVHIGQAGIQMGEALWHRYFLEHDVPVFGQEDPAKPLEPCSSLFHEGEKSKFLPRAVFADLDDTTISQLKKSRYGKNFHPSNLLSGKEDSADNFARGRYTTGVTLCTDIQDRIRKEAQRCDLLQGFVYYHSTGGGTGSGMLSRLIYNTHHTYTKKTKCAFSLFPSPNLRTGVLEIYNSLLSTQEMSEYLDLVTFLQNEALYGIADRQVGIEEPDYYSINRLIAQFSSGVTSSLRFRGRLNNSLTHIMTNLVPYPKLKYIIGSFAPWVGAGNVWNNLSVNQMTQKAFSQESTLCNVDLSRGNFMSCTMQYSENVTHYEASKAARDLCEQQNIKTEDWAPTGFKIGLNDHVPSPYDIETQKIVKMHRALTVLANNSAITFNFQDIMKQFDVMYAKRAFVFWYVCEGMEESEFYQSKDNLQNIIKEYRQSSSVQGHRGDGSQSDGERQPVLID